MRDAPPPAPSGADDSRHALRELRRFAKRQRLGATRLSLRRTTAPATAAAAAAAPLWRLRQRQQEQRQLQQLPHRERRRVARELRAARNQRRALHRAAPSRAADRGDRQRGDPQRVHHAAAPRPPVHGHAKEGFLGRQQHRGPTDGAPAYDSDAALEDAREIAHLEKLLGITKRQKRRRGGSTGAPEDGDGSDGDANTDGDVLLPPGFARDGLDYILHYKDDIQRTDGGGDDDGDDDDGDRETHGTAHKRSRRATGASGDVRASDSAGSMARSDRRAHGSDDDGDSGASDGRVGHDDHFGDPEATCGADEQETEPCDNGNGPALGAPSGTPSVRVTLEKSAQQSASAAQTEERLIRRMRGLLNRLSPGNVELIARDVEQLFRTVGRSAATHTLAALALDICSDAAKLLSQLLLALAALVAVLHGRVGCEVGAFVVQSMIERFDHVYRNR